MFFFYSAEALIPPPPPDFPHGMLATSFVMIALVLLMLVEILNIYLKWLDPFANKTGKKARREFSELSGDIFSTIERAAGTVSKITRSTGSTRANKRKRRG